mmetsp:Transcript_2777/g.8936  ORF Transcript_2777/g.8936 Transcript_2777/m.8936 type:complete len:579 (+) Transcript_2777:2342-4078(+)
MERRAELHLPQERLEVVQPGVRRGFHERLQHALLRVQTLGLVLVEVVHEAQVFGPERCDARDRLLFPLNQPHHRRLPAPVGADHRDAFAAVDLQRRVLEQRLLVVPVREVLHSRDDLRRALRVRELKPALLLHPRLLHRVREEPLERLRRGVRAAGLAAAGEPSDHLALTRHLLHVLLVHHHLRRASAAFRALVVAVVSLVRRRLPALDLHGLRAELVEELSVVRHDHHGDVYALEVPFQPLDRVQVEVVRGLVHEQQPGLLKENLPERDSHLPPPGEGRDEPVVVLRDEPQRRHDLIDGAFHVEQIEPLRFLLELVELLEENRHELHARLVLELFLYPLRVPDHLALLPERRHELLSDGVRFFHLELLREVSDLHLVREHDLALVCFHLAGDDSQLRRLPRAVPSHQAHLLTAFAVPRDVLQDLHALERLLHALQAHARGHRPAASTLRRLRVFREDVPQVHRDRVPVVGLLLGGVPVDRRQSLFLLALAPLFFFANRRLGRFFELLLRHLLHLLLFDDGLGLDDRSGGGGGGSSLGRRRLGRLRGRDRFLLRVLAFGLFAQQRRRLLELLRLRRGG